MDDKILILAGIMGIDISSAADSKFMAYCIKGIEDMEAFIDYCADNRDGVQYVKRTERLHILAKRFKQIEEDARLAEQRRKSMTFAQRLTEKVVMCRHIVEDNPNAKWAGIKQKETMEPVFEPHETRALDAIGSPIYVAELSRLHKLEDAISDEYMKRIKGKKSYEALAAGERKVGALLANAAKGVKA